MARIIRRNKALSVSPVKASQPLGGALAMLGMERAIPMLHGAQGCTAFAKVFLVRHFREPIPLQTTAMDQVSAVMGADESLIEGLATVCSKSRPDLIGVLTTGLSETEGADVERVVRDFRLEHPEFADVAVVPVSTPDFAGSAETGFALAVTALIDHLVPESRQVGGAPEQVNILAGSALTPGDVEALKDMVEAFGLEPLMVPDLSGSLDGHLSEARLSPLTTGGTPLSHLQRLGSSVATLVIGASMTSPAEHLQARTGVPNVHFDSLMGMESMDELMLTLSRLSGNPVPLRLQRERARLQDAMLDAHFTLGFSRVAIAGDPDLLHGFSSLVREIGGEVVAAVAPSRAPVLERVAAEAVKIGDLQDLEDLAREGRAQYLIANTHGVEPARRLGIPLLRAGFPQYDWLGGFQRTWIGYAGARQALFDLANLQVLSPSHGVAPYRSIYAEPEAQSWEEPPHGTTASSAGDHATWH